MYHQVTDKPVGTTAGEGHYGPAVTPKQFDSDLSYLVQHGFRPVDPLVALKYLDGEASAVTLPDRPYMLTFDDGFESAWTTATSILRAHNAKAMMFVEGARTDTTAGRLTSDEIRAMAKSGSWEIESHGYAGHSGLRIGSQASDVSPYWYANLAWLPDANRRETPVEFEARVLADLRHSKETLEHIAGTPVTAFAYPSGEYGQSIAVPAGGDSDTIGADQGHSNATGLTPLLFDVLQRAGFTSAFAVVVPGSETAASPTYAPYRLPRVGGSPQIYQPDILTLSDGEIPLPVVSPDYHWLDCKPVSATAKQIWVASAAQPYLFALDDHTGRIDAIVHVPALQRGREGQPVLAAGLVARPDGTFAVYQQKGWWPGGQARLLSFRLVSGKAADLTSVNLDESAAWFVGTAEVKSHLLALTEDGGVYTLDGASFRELFALENSSPGWKGDDVGRFVGPAYAHGLLYVADRKDRQILGVDPASGEIKERSALPAGSDIRAVGGDDDYLWLVNYSQDRRLLIRLRSIAP